ncbi:MAG: alpha/beta fold hydrolase, partial [Actinomycetes bacterium]
SEMWSAQREAFGTSCRVITPDQRGFGGSGLGVDEPSLDHVADDVAAMLDRLALDRVVLGGLSMGGYASMAFLRRHPDRVRALVLADTKAGADPEPAREKRERIATRLDAEGTPAALVEEVLPALFGPTTARERPQVAARVAALVETASPSAGAWAQRAMAARPDSLDTLRSVDVPALVVLGDEDELSTRADADAMVDALPDGRLAVLPGSGHLTALEVPEAFNEAVQDFLADLQ